MRNRRWLASHCCFGGKQTQCSARAPEYGPLLTVSVSRAAAVLGDIPRLTRKLSHSPAAGALANAYVLDEDMPPRDIHGMAFWEGLQAELNVPPYGE